MTFEEFAAEWMAALQRFSTALANDRGLGEDLLQDVLLRAYSQWERVSAADDPYAYVRRMVVNEFVSWRRKWGRVSPRSDIMDVLHSPVSDAAAVHAERDSLLIEIDRLPRRQRAVVVLRYFEDLPDDEIANILGCSASTVRVHSMRALRALRVQLTLPAPCLMPPTLEANS